MNKNKFKNVFFGFLMLVLFFGSIFLLYSQMGDASLSTTLKRAVSYAYAAPYSSDQRGIVQVKYETYQLAGSYIKVPSQGNKEQSQDFPGYDIYEYFYPANPEKNTDQRKKLYSFKGNGSVEVSGNTVINGDRTQLYNEYDSGTMGIASYDTSAGERENMRHYVSLKPRSSDVVMDGSADINYSWKPEDESGGLGPSIFLNPNSSRLEFEKTYYLSDAKQDSVIETSLMAEKDTYFWKKYLSTGEDVDQLQNATAFFYKEPYFFITDMGNRRLVRYNPSTDEFDSLGKRDWNWIIGGITVDDDGYMFVTDSAMNTIIKTKITGEGWEESYRDIDDYQSRLFLDGSENYKVRGVNGSFADDVTVNDCGYTSHKVVATSSTGHIEVDPANDKPTMMSTEGCAFGDSCFSFNGHEHLDLPDDAAWNFGDDFFTIDMWVQFSSLDKTMALISYPGSYLFEWEPGGADLSTSSLKFAFMNSNRSDDGNYTYQTFSEHWLPEVNEWYHLAIVRNEDNELEMMVDGETLGEPVPITGDLLDGQGVFQVGGYFKEKELAGKLDNVRVARGRTKWVVDYSYRYEFNHPRGIILVDDYLYIVDSGNNRIVKMSKDFHEWSTFGGPGSGDFQFNNPTDIYYFDGSFYITDTGNHRVVKTDMAEMVHYLKGESGGSWEVVYESESPGLWGVMVDAENVLITDEYNGQIIKNGEIIGSKNPWDLLFKFTSPVDIQPGPEGHYYILDGTSNYDFSTHVATRAMDLYGTAQKEGINANFEAGGVKTDNVRSQGVIAKLNLPDWQKWIGDEAGPAVAHCPGLPGSEIEADNKAIDFGNCDGGRWTGLGQHVDCTNPNNAPPSECVGQWDWEVHWPHCVRYVPAYDRVKVCNVPKYCNSDGTSSQGNVDTGIVCGCSDTDLDCFSYCQAEELDCHEGYAVAHEFLEKGPPEWAKKDQEGK